MSAFQKRLCDYVGGHPQLEGLIEVFKFVERFSGATGIVLALASPLLAYGLRTAYEHGLQGYFSYYQMYDVCIKSDFNAVITTTLVALGVIGIVFLMNLIVLMQSIAPEGWSVRITNLVFMWWSVGGLMCAIAIFATPQVWGTDHFFEMLIGLGLFFLAGLVLLALVRRALKKAGRHRKQKSVGTEIRSALKKTGWRACVGAVLCLLLFYLSYLLLGNKEFWSMLKLVWVLGQGAAFVMGSSGFLAIYYWINEHRTNKKPPYLYISAFFLILLGAATMNVHTFGKMIAESKKEYNCVIIQADETGSFIGKAVVYQTEDSVYAVSASYKDGQLTLVPGQYQRLEKNELWLTRVRLQAPPAFSENLSVMKNLEKL